MKVPARVSWAADLLQVQPGRRVLEVGCGRGYAAHVLAPRLGVNGYVGLDRSKVAIQAARKLNGEMEGSGIARFVLGELGEADVGSRRFGEILAINVNAFWTDDGEAAATCLPLMTGRMLLVYELPLPSKTEEVTEKLRVAMRAGGFLMLNTVKPPPGQKGWIAMWARKG